MRGVFFALWPGPGRAAAAANFSEKLFQSRAGPRAGLEKVFRNFGPAGRPARARPKGKKNTPHFAPNPMNSPARWKKDHKKPYVYPYGFDGFLTDPCSKSNVAKKYSPAPAGTPRAPLIPAFDPKRGGAG